MRRNQARDAVGEENVDNDVKQDSFSPWSLDRPTAISILAGGTVVFPAEWFGRPGLAGLLAGLHLISVVLCYEFLGDRESLQSSIARFASNFHEGLGERITPQSKARETVRRSNKSLRGWPMVVFMHAFGVGGVVYTLSSLSVVPSGLAMLMTMVSAYGFMALHKYVTYALPLPDGKGISIVDAETSMPMWLYFVVFVLSFASMFTVALAIGFGANWVSLVVPSLLLIGLGGLRQDGQDG